MYHIGASFWDTIHAKSSQEKQLQHHGHHAACPMEE